jgi:alginate biosynthesis protein AlgX
MLRFASFLSRCSAAVIITAFLPGLAVAQQAGSFGNAAPADSVFTWDANQPTAPKNQALNCPRLGDGDLNDSRYYQGADGWFFRSFDLIETIAFSKPVMADFKRLNAVLKARGTTLVAMPLPTRAQFGAEFRGNVHQDILPRPEVLEAKEKQLRSELAEAGITNYVPPTAYPADAAFKRDTHWTTVGSNLIVALTAKSINEHPALKDLPRKAYATKDTGEIFPVGKLQEAIQPYCDDSFPRESMKTYRTEQSAETAADLFGDGATDTAAGASGEDLLFGDTGKPPIALVGTSFSSDKYNVDGALMQQTGLETASYAISGGGPFGSILTYLATLPEGEAPAKALVWEFQRTIWLHKYAPMGFRQVIPAAKGVCQATKQIRKDSFALGGDKVFDLALAPGEKMAGQDDYLTIKFDKPTVRDLLVTFTYEDGQIEEVPVILHSNLAFLDRYFLELSGDFDVPLKSVNITTSHKDPVNATLQLCDGDLTP